MTQADQELFCSQFLELCRTNQDEYQMERFLREANHLRFVNDTTDVSGRNPLFYACENPNPKIFQLIAHKCPELLIKSDNSHLSLLHWAVIIRKEHMLHVILSQMQQQLCPHQSARRKHHNPALLEQINRKNQHGRTPLHITSLFCNLPAAQLLIQFNADLNCIDNKGLFPLHYAVQRLSEQSQKILSARSNCSLPNTPAARGGEEGGNDLFTLTNDNVVLLNINEFENGDIFNEKFINTKLSQCLEMVHLLIEHGADVTKKDPAGKSALAWAILMLDFDSEEMKWSSQKCVSLLLKQDVSFVNERDNNGLTIIHYMCNRNSHELLFTLKSITRSLRQIEWDSPDCQGCTPLMYATRAQNQQCVKILLRLNEEIRAEVETDAEVDSADMLLLTNVSQVDKNGRSAFHIAAANGDTEILRLLMCQANADAWMVSKVNRETPLLEAIKNDRTETAKLLLHEAATASATVTVAKQHEIDASPAECREDEQLTASSGCWSSEKSAQLLQHTPVMTDSEKLRRDRINFQNSRKQSALYLCVIKNHVELVDLLLEMNASCHRDLLPIDEPTTTTNTAITTATAGGSSAEEIGLSSSLTHLSTSGAGGVAGGLVSSSNSSHPLMRLAKSNECRRVINKHLTKHHELRQSSLLHHANSTIDFELFSSQQKSVSHSPMPRVIEATHHTVGRSLPDMTQNQRSSDNKKLSEPHQQQQTTQKATALLTPSYSVPTTVLINEEKMQRTTARTYCLENEETNHELVHESTHEVVHESARKPSESNRGAQNDKKTVDKLQEIPGQTLALHSDEATVQEREYLSVQKLVNYHAPTFPHQSSNFATPINNTQSDNNDNINTQINNNISNNTNKKYENSNPICPQETQISICSVPQISNIASNNLLTQFIFDGIQSLILDRLRNFSRNGNTFDSVGSDEFGRTAVHYCVLPLPTATAYPGHTCEYATSQLTSQQQQMKDADAKPVSLNDKRRQCLSIILQHCSQTLVNQVDVQGFAPMHYLAIRSSVDKAAALEDGQTQMLEIEFSKLLIEFGADLLLSTSKEAKTCLYLALASKNVEFIRFLCDVCTRENSTVWVQLIRKTEAHLRDIDSGSGGSIGHIAVLGSGTNSSMLKHDNESDVASAECLKLILEASSNCNNKIGINLEAKNQQGDTALMSAVKHGRYHVAAILIRNGGADVNCTDKRKSTPLHFVAAAMPNTTVAAGNPEDDDNGASVKSNLWMNLLESNIGTATQLNYTGQDQYGKTPLFYAVSTGNECVCNAILDREHVANDRPWLEICSPDEASLMCMQAVHSGSLPVLQRVLDCGATAWNMVHSQIQSSKAVTPDNKETNKKDEDDESDVSCLPIHQAVLADRLDMFECLLANLNSDLSHHNQQHHEQHHEQQKQEQQAPSHVAKQLLNTRNTRGQTVLHMTVELERTEMCAVLLTPPYLQLIDLNAAFHDRSAKTFKTALDLAKTASCRQLLENAGALSWTQASQLLMKNSKLLHQKQRSSSRTSGMSDIQRPNRNKVEATKKRKVVQQQHQPFSVIRNLSHSTFCSLTVSDNMEDAKPVSSHSTVVNKVNESREQKRLSTFSNSKIDSDSTTLLDQKIERPKQKQNHKHERGSQSAKSSQSQIERRSDPPPTKLSNKRHPTAGASQVRSKSSAKIGERDFYWPVNLSKLTKRLQQNPITLQKIKNRSATSAIQGHQTGVTVDTKDLKSPYLQSPKIVTLPSVQYWLLKQTQTNTLNSNLKSSGNNQKIQEQQVTVKSSQFPVRRPFTAAPYQNRHSNK